MQDNPIDPKWENEGWSKMQQLLDQEMPVGAAVRYPERLIRVRPAVMLLFFMLLAGIAYWLLNDNRGVQPPYRLKAFAIPVPSVVAGQSGQESAFNAAEHRLSGAATASISNPQTTAKPSNTLPVKRSMKAGSETLPSSANTSPEPVAAASNSALVFTEEVAEAKNRPKVTVPPVLSTNTPILLPSSSADLAVPSITTPAEPTLHYGLEAGLGTNTFNSLQSWTIAAYTSFSLDPSAQWYARIKAGYLQVNDNQSTGEQQFLFQNSRLSANSAVPTILQMRTQLSELHYVFLQPNIGRWFHPRLGLEAGLQYAYLLDATTTTQWSLSTDPEMGTPADSPEEDNLGKLPLQLDQEQVQHELQRQQLSLQLGLRYRVNPAFTIGLYWQQGLTDITPSQRGLYNSFAQIAGAYTLR